MLVRISEIQVKKRIRKDSGNINELSESMNIHGLMNPIVLTREYQLIAGFRRLESAKKLGWENIEWFPVEWCRSFKDHCMPGGILNSLITPTKIPEGAKIIVFHGQPNPPDAIAGTWGAPVQWYKRFYKTVKPTKWIEAYWK